LTGRASFHADDSFATDLEVCMEVLLYLHSLMSRLAPGQVLAFTSSDPDAETTIGEWVEQRGYTLLHVESQDDGRTRLLIQKDDAAHPAS
jgi:TusA-related sulfurtransferase